jgi:murein DD-endopeptidase MepM/ murein hydrolase activator NlpD
MFERECYAAIVLCHGKKILVPEGYKPKLGELLMIADNTSFSTGLHTHFGVYRVDGSGNKLDQNEATGSFDPSLFFTNEYAVDLAALPTLIISNLRYYKYRLGV